jgi:hypothetical protein
VDETTGWGKAALWGTAAAVVAGIVLAVASYTGPLPVSSD